MPHLLVDVTSRDTIRRWMQLRMPHPFVGVASPLLISLPLSMFTKHRMWCASISTIAQRGNERCGTYGLICGAIL